MEIFQSFGINPILTIAQIVNFLVILYIFKRYLYGPIATILQKRQDVIKNGLKSAEDSKRAFENAKSEEKKILKLAKSESDRILDDSRKQAGEIIEKAREQAKKQQIIMLSEAESQIEKQTRDVEKKLISHIGRIAEQVLKESLKGLMTQKEQEEIVNQAMKRIDRK